MREGSGNILLGLFLITGHVSGFYIYGITVKGSLGTIKISTFAIW